MSNMIEKVARAINPLLWEAYDKAPVDEHGLDESISLSLTKARRAIEAMMEATDDMITEDVTITAQINDKVMIIPNDAVKKPFQAMIEEALGNET